jgi:type I restriction enzyme S subunit
MNSMANIGSFCKVRRGASPRPIGNPNYFGGNVGWIRISDVTKSNKYLNKTEQYVSPLGESLSVRVDKGDLVMSICGTIGRPVIINIPSCIHDGFVQLYDIRNADIEYLYYILQYHEKDFEAKGQPGTQVNLNTTIVENFEVYFPDLYTQRQIATILSTADAVIEQTQAAIAKYKAIKQGMLQDLFTRGIDTTTGKLRPSYQDAPELYKESKLGWIPKEWEVEKVGEVCSMKSGEGITSKSIYEMSDFPVYGGNGLRGYTNSFTHDGEYTLVGRQGALCGNITRVSAKFYASEHAVVVTVEKEIDVDWLSQKLDTMNLNQYSEASAQPGLSVNKILRLPILKPPFAEQINIAERLIAVDKKLQTEQAFLHKQQQIKAGLMNDLLSGKKKASIKETITANE